LYWAHSCLIFFTEHKPYKVFVIHFIFCGWFKFSGDLFKNSINSLSRQGMTFISGEVFFIYEKVMVSIKFPKSTIQDIEMFIWKVLSHNIYVTFLTHLLKYFHQITLFKISPSYFAIIIRIHHKKYSHYNCISISILKFRCCFKKFKTRMCLK
jgi:hypothetical protein